MRTNKMALAAATATAVALGSLATPAMAAETGIVKGGDTAATGKTTTGKTDNTGKTTNGKTGKTGNTDNSGNAAVESGSSLKGMEPKEIKEWLGVITAVLSILGTLATFAMKYAPQFAPQR